MKPSEMDPKRWRQIDRLLDAALETPVEERDAFLAEACAADEQLRAELEALLTAHARADDVLEPPRDLPSAALEAYRAAAPGDRLVGPFRLERELGRGGMGVVYLAEDTRLGRRVALKALPPYLGTGPEAKERFRAEARAVCVLDHPNIATLYETGETGEGQLYMAFAYYRGETLEARIAREPMGMDEAVEIAEGIAAGLAAAHEAGIIHRDVKPSNVLLAEGGVKLLDFGVAKVVGEDVTREGVRLGTVAYMSPEQASGGPVDHRTDLWSLGVVLYEMLTGRRPFRAEDPLSLRDAILHDEPPTPASLLDSVPRALDEVVARLLAKNPDDRYGGARELLVDLGAVAAEDGPELPVRTPAQGPSRLGRWLGRRIRAWSSRPRARRAAAMIFVAVAIIGAAIAGAFWIDARGSAAGGMPDIGRLAVLPLENLTGDPEQRYFVDGIHDALVAELGKIGAFGVISRTSVMRYRDSKMTIPEIAAELGVDAVVEGSVFRQGDSLAVTAQLIAASPERHLWAHRYRRSVADVFAITGEAARAIAAEIDVGPGPGVESRLDAPRSVDPRAYDAYVRGWVHWERRNRDGFELARSYFRQAIAFDSTFAAAYAGLAQTYNGAADWLFTEPTESFRRARGLLETAAEMDSTLPEVYAAMAAIENMHDWEWEEAAELSARAVEVNPSDVHALRELGSALAKLGRPDEARAFHERASELDTQIPGMGTAFNSYSRREFDRAIEHARVAKEFDEGVWQAPMVACLALSGKGLHDQAIEECENAAGRFGRDNPLLLASLGYVYAVGGRRVEARRIVEELDRLAGEAYVAPGLIAMVYGALGETDLAFEWLDRAYEGRDTFLMKLRAPFFDPLRADPRFDVLLRKIGFV